jgi:hypothetical protein
MTCTGSFPAQSRYLDKSVVKDMDIVPQEEREGCITEADDHCMR